MNTNTIIIAGNLVRDPVDRMTHSGKPVATFQIANNRRYTGEDGELKEKTCFIECVIWGKRSRVIVDYFRKGMPIMVEGHLQLERWEHGGNQYQKHTINVSDFHFMQKADKESANGR